jgi:hypothetical protein
MPVKPLLDKHTPGGSLFMYFGYLLLYDLPKGVSPGRKTAI